MKKIIQILGLSLLVVILPGASWYFLKSGLDYRLDSMDKLGDFGKLQDTELTLSNGKVVDTKRLVGKMVVLHELQNPRDTTKIMQFYRQFSKRLDLQFILTDTELLRLKADRTSNLWLLADSKENLEFITATGIRDQELKNVVLVDINGDIRSYYNLEKIEELQQMVEHTAFLLPVKETDKPIMQRAAEK